MFSIEGKIISYESLRKVLRTINDKKDLDKDNIIQKIQEELKKQDQGLYQEWEKNGFDVNRLFILDDREGLYRKGLLSLLIIAAENGYAKTVDVLLKAGASVDKGGWFVPLYDNDCDKIWKSGLGGRAYLIERSNYTALHCAAFFGYEETVKLLLKKGADVNAVDQDGRTPLDHTKDYTKYHVRRYDPEYYDK